RVDGPGPNTVTFGEVENRRGVVHAAGHVPEHVERNRRTDAGDLVHEPGVAELLLERHGRRRLYELAKSCAGVRKSPRRQLDLKATQRAEYSLHGRHVSSYSCFNRKLRYSIFIGGPTCTCTPISPSKRRPSGSSSMTSLMT